MLARQLVSMASAVVVVQCKSFSEVLKEDERMKSTKLTSRDIHQSEQKKKRHCSLSLPDCNHKLRVSTAP